jgi:hypothetical protein
MLDPIAPCLPDLLKSVLRQPVLPFLSKPVSEPILGTELIDVCWEASMIS